MRFNILVTRLEVVVAGSNSVRAYADVRLDSGAGSLRLHCLRVLESKGRPLWVAFPQKAGKNGKSYFPVVEAEGNLRDLIVNAVLDAYNQRASKS